MICCWIEHFSMRIFYFINLRDEKEEKEKEKEIENCNLSFSNAKRFNSFFWLVRKSQS